MFKVCLSVCLSICLNLRLPILTLPVTLVYAKYRVHMGIHIPWVKYFQMRSIWTSFWLWPRLCHPWLVIWNVICFQVAKATLVTHTVLILFHKISHNVCMFYFKKNYHRIQQSWIKSKNIVKCCYSNSCYGDDFFLYRYTARYGKSTRHRFSFNFELIYIVVLTVIRIVGLRSSFVLNSYTPVTERQTGLWRQWLFSPWVDISWKCNIFSDNLGYAEKSKTEHCT